MYYDGGNVSTVSQHVATGSRIAKQIATAGTRLNMYVQYSTVRYREEGHFPVPRSAGAGRQGYIYIYIYVYMYVYISMYLSLARAL